MIRGKIRNVQDAVCKGCSQLWNGECRAFQMPHSDEEYEHRKKGGEKANCRRKRTGQRK